MFVVYHCSLLCFSFLLNNSFFYDNQLHFCHHNLNIIYYVYVYRIIPFFFSYFLVLNSIQFYFSFDRIIIINNTDTNVLINILQV
jgi:hypothetical protein